METQIPKFDTLQPINRIPPELRSDRNAREMNAFAVGVILGAGIGAILGIILGNFSLGVAIGVGVGIIGSDILQHQRK